MLEDSVLYENSSLGAEGVAGTGTDAMMVELGDECGYEDGERNSSGSRWPQEETFALLKIRSDMEMAFRDSAQKAPLWDEVSRKLAELGYHRSAKKCKEKFENVSKYHKRTKEARSSSQKAKNYRFFEQLELLDSNFCIPSAPMNQISLYSMETVPTPSTTVMTKAVNSGQELNLPCTDRDHDVDFMSAPTSMEFSSEESEGSIKKKRKLVDYFERLMKDVLEKQEELQNKFLEAIEKCEKERIAREEAWKVQEMARIKREKELFAQERAMAAAKDAAMLAFLQKLTQQTIPVQMPDILTTLFDKPSENLGNALEKHSELQENAVGESSTRTDRQDNSAGESTILMSSSRWPKAEVETLIMLKTDLDSKYHENGPKGPLWEEISSSMKKHGYDRTAKRCKEKWENINKYYKRVKDSNKRRPEDSKTCPYFNLLDSIYARKSKKLDCVSDNDASIMKPEQILMQMIGESDALNQDDDAEEEQGDNSGNGYQIIGNNLSSVTTSLS